MNLDHTFIFHLYISFFIFTRIPFSKKEISNFFLDASLMGHLGGRQMGNKCVAQIHPKNFCIYFVVLYFYCITIQAQFFKNICIFAHRMNAFFFTKTVKKNPTNCFEKKLQIKIQNFLDDSGPYIVVPHLFPTRTFPI